MTSCRKITSLTKRFFRRLRKPFPRSRQDTTSADLALGDDWIAVEADDASQTADSEVPTTENILPQPADVVVQPTLPQDCNKLNPEDIVFHGDHPVRAGAFTNVWEGSLDGAHVVIKAYRIYSADDPTPALIRYYTEALACTLLSHRNVVSFRAAYITPQHPLALVYDFMGHRCLREYIAGNVSAARIPLLVDIARGLHHMHDSGVIHGNLKAENILVDLNGTARIAGLGSAFIPTRNHSAWSEMNAEVPSYGSAPELVLPNPPGKRVITTKESDIYSFSLLAWELFAGHVPFPGIHRSAAVYALATGKRPPRPDHPELSDIIWTLIEKCWNDDPLHRPPVETVLAILQGEVS